MSLKAMIFLSCIGSPESGAGVCQAMTHIVTESSYVECYRRANVITAGAVARAKAKPSITITYCAALEQTPAAVAYHADEFKSQGYEWLGTTVTYEGES